MFYHDGSKKGDKKIWKEFGEIGELKLKFNIEKKDAFSRSDGFAKKVDSVVTKMEATLNWTTQRINKENLKMLFYANETEVKSGDVEWLAAGLGKEFKDKTTAISKLGVLKRLDVQMPLVFIGDKMGDSVPVLYMPLVSIAPGGDFDFISDDWSKMSFEGNVLEVGGVFADEYLIPKNALKISDGEFSDDTFIKL